MQLVGHRAAGRQIGECNLVGWRNNQHVGLAAIVICELHRIVDFSQRQSGVRARHVADVCTRSGGNRSCPNLVKVRDVTKKLPGFAGVGSRLGFVCEQRFVDVAALFDALQNLYLK